MTTLNQIIYDLRNILRGGALVSDDDPISDRQLEFWVHSTRATLIRRQIDKGQTLSENIIQSLPCVEVEQVDASENPELISGCYLVKTKLRVPKFIESAEEDMLLKVSTPKLGSIPYSIFPVAAMPYVNYNKFGKHTVKAFLKEGYLYLMNTPFIEHINITGVFEDPKELAQFNDCSNAPCFTSDGPYPISNQMLDTLKRLIIDTHFKFLQKPLSDNTNNAQNNLEEQQAK